MMKWILSVSFILLLFAGSGCSKEENVVAPSDFSVVIVTEDSTRAVGSSMSVRAKVTDSNGDPANGIGVLFTTDDSTVASFSSGSTLAQKSVDSDSSGIAEVTVYALSAGTATITADIRSVSDSMTLTVE